jgi:hypothetical protein
VIRNRLLLLIPGLGLALALALGACSSQIPTLRDWAEPLVGRNVGELRTLELAEGSYASRTGWQERSYTLGNGNWVYVHPDRPNCAIHFEVNRDDRIIGYTPVGTGCRYQ